MSDNLTFAQQAANRGDSEWTNTFAALAQAEALERIANWLNKPEGPDPQLERIAASLEMLAECINHDDDSELTTLQISNTYK